MLEQIVVEISSGTNLIEPNAINVAANINITSLGIGGIIFSIKAKKQAIKTTYIPGTVCI